jgi:hypothetical protein
MVGRQYLAGFGIHACGEQIENALGFFRRHVNRFR